MLFFVDSDSFVDGINTIALLITTLVIIALLLLVILGLVCGIIISRVRTSRTQTKSPVGSNDPEEYVPMREAAAGEAACQLRASQHKELQVCNCRGITGMSMLRKL